MNFPLLSDPEHKVIEAYGSWGLKKFMGREYMGILRQSFLIDENGIIVAKGQELRGAGLGTSIQKLVKES